MEPLTQSARVSPEPSPEEAAAIAAALARFTQDTAVPLHTEPPTQSPWQRAALLEGIARAAAWG